MQRSFLVPVLVFLALAALACSTTRPIQIDPATCQERADDDVLPRFNGSTWELENGAVRCGVPVHVGDRIDEWAVFFTRYIAGAAVEVRLQRLEAVSQLRVDVPPVRSDSLSMLGYFPLGAALEEPELVNEDHSYGLLVTGLSGPGDRLGVMTVWVTSQ